MSMTYGTFIPQRIDVKNYRISKSSHLMDAIADCLFEEGRDGQLGGWLREGEKIGAITFEFSMGGTEYRVVRNHTKGGKGTLAFNRCTESGDWEDCGDSTAKLTQAKIKQTLGMAAPDLLLLLRQNGGEKKSIQKTSIAAQVCTLYEESHLLKTLLKCLTNVVDSTESLDILGAVKIAADLAERLTAGIDAAVGTASQDLVCSIYEMDEGETDMPLDEMNARLEATCKDLFKQMRQTGGC